MHQVLVTTTYGGAASNSAAVAVVILWFTSRRAADVATALIDANSKSKEYSQTALYLGDPSAVDPETISPSIY